MSVGGSGLGLVLAVVVALALGVVGSVAPSSGGDPARACAGLLDKVGQPSDTLFFRDAWGRHEEVGAEFEAFHAEAAVSGRES